MEPSKGEVEWVELSPARGEHQLAIGIHPADMADNPRRIKVVEGRDLGERPIVVEVEPAVALGVHVISGSLHRPKSPMAAHARMAAVHLLLKVCKEAARIEEADSGHDETMHTPHVQGVALKGRAREAIEYALIPSWLPWLVDIDPAVVVIVVVRADTAAGARVGWRRRGRWWRSMVCHGR